MEQLKRDGGETIVELITQFSIPLWSGRLNRLKPKEELDKSFVFPYFKF